MIECPDSLESRDRARRKTEELATQMRGAVLAEQLWYDKLSPKERAHLGGDLEKAYGEFGLVGMVQKLRGCSQPYAVLDVGRQLKMIDTKDFDELLDHLGEVPRDPELLLQRAVDAGHLVLRDAEERMLFWAKESLETPLLESEILWDVFVELVKRSKSGTSLDSFCYPKKTEGYVRKAINRIRNEMELPSDLTTRIVAWERYGQKLDMLPEKIRLFESDGRGEVREWLP